VKAERLDRYATTMKVGDHVYFAPDIRFSDLDLDGPLLPEQYRTRIEGYYLTPAHRAAEAGDAFAAGLLVLAAVDAMSRLYFGLNRPSRKVKIDFPTFVRLFLPSFSAPASAEILYDKYRNGLVHEARLKDGCQFELGRAQTFDNTGPTPIIDPRHLVAKVRSALDKLVSEMNASQTFRSEFAKCLREEFRYELG
jgi:hypothetical protein